MTSPGPYYLGRHCALREVSAEDIRTLYAQPVVLDVLADYRPWYKPKQHPVEWIVQRQAWLASVQPSLELEALVLSIPEQAPLGFICLAGIDLTNGKAELTLGMFRRKGSRSMLEALHWVLETGFANLHKLVFCVSPENLPAKQFAESLGLPLEATLKEELLADDGSRTDLLRYALTAPQWRVSRLRQLLQTWVPLNAPTS